MASPVVLPYRIFCTWSSMCFLFLLGVSSVFCLTFVACLGVWPISLLCVVTVPPVTLAAVSCWGCRAHLTLPLSISAFWIAFVSPRCLPHSFLKKILSFFLHWFISNAGALPGESACVPSLVGLQGLVASPWKSDPVLLHGFLSNVAHSVRLSLLAWLSFTFVLFTFSSRPWSVSSRPWSVFSTCRDIVTSFLYGKSVVPPGWIGFGVLRLFVDHGLVRPSLDCAPSGRDIV